MARTKKVVEEVKEVKKSKQAEAAAPRRRKKVYNLESSVRKLWAVASDGSCSLSRDANETLANVAKELAVCLTKEATSISRVEGYQKVMPEAAVGAFKLVFSKSESFADKCAIKMRKAIDKKTKGTELGLTLSVPRIEKIIRANINAGSQVSGTTPAAMACAVECALSELMDECVKVMKAKKNKSEKPKLLNRHIYRAVHKNAVFCHLSGKLGFLGMGAIPKERQIERDADGKIIKNKKNKPKVVPMHQTEVKTHSNMNKLNNEHFVIQAAGVRRRIKECIEDARIKEGIQDSARVSPAASAVIHAAAEHYLGLVLSGCREIMNANAKQVKSLKDRHIHAALKIVDASFCLRDLPVVEKTEGSRFVVSDSAAKRLALRAGIQRASAGAYDLIRSIFDDFICRHCNAAIVFLGKKRTLSYAMAVGGAHALGIKAVLGEHAARKLKFKNPKTTSK